MGSVLNFRTLDLNLLRVFDAVMAERNLTRAGERIGLSQPAVSAALKVKLRSDGLVGVASNGPPNGKAARALALAEQPLDGFEPLLAGDALWQIEQTTIRLQHPLGQPAGPGEDEPRAATRFLAPDGSVQFVALIDDE